jgi:glutaminyl-peptide cyclotransferase
MGQELKRRAWGRPVLAITLVGLLIGVFLLKSCAPDGPPPAPEVKPDVPVLVPAPVFNGDSAYALVAKQVSFGPRVPGSKEHSACADWMVALLKAHGADTVHQQLGKVTAFNGNIIASWNPEAKERVLLMAHYDTRPFADHDDERQNQPIEGANDGGSGVAVLLEIARHLSSAGSPFAEGKLGIDLFFTDVEDMGQPNEGVMGAAMQQESIKTWCLGSQYWVRNPHVPGYSARYGILLDMCGSKDATFPREALSMRFAPLVVNRIWKAAAATGNGDRFLSETRGFVGIDDHVVVNEGTGIPVADIIAWDASTNAFPKTWHTHDDNLSGIDKESLRAVGETVMQVLWSER